MKIPFELKLSVLVAVFAVYKLLDESGLRGFIPDVFFLLLNRAVFVLAHMTFLYAYKVRSAKVDLDKTTSIKDKLELKRNLKSTMRYIVARAFGVAYIHYYYESVPLLACAVAIGALSILDTEKAFN